MGKHAFLKYRAFHTKLGSEGIYIETNEEFCTSLRAAERFIKSQGEDQKGWAYEVWSPDLEGIWQELGWTGIPVHGEVKLAEDGTRLWADRPRLAPPLPLQRIQRGKRTYWVAKEGATLYWAVD